MSLGRRLRDLRYKIFYGAILSKGCRLTELGNRQGYFQWTFCPDGLGPGSIVYSGGVGKDLSFEKGLVKEYGCPVVLFDGTPTGNQTMSLPENNLPQFKYNRAALADKPGKLHLTPPESSEEGSWSLQNAGTATIEVPCIDLSTLMEQNGHSHIDLLKID
ncbi:MAG TPA: hypothetical protein VGY98_13590, partial [Verrucomicrobiae bacterium]|nr:hypothetical protein [Verrucomicrobiae bacterium]